MRKKPANKQSHDEKVVIDIRCATRKQYSGEEKIRIMLDDMRSEDSNAVDLHAVLIFCKVHATQEPLDNCKLHRGSEPQVINEKEAG
ncbi:hypothetical protein RUE5091_00187 [Ruegeria denitrificans]|uniref:Uncharacterized protein n=1 Tax=Ruegeria denitrificans TaxID=1715692 RepID=A0A0P1I144_9RHOB|nr:hypothetical protein RUE5091_00187 [Ruegeria denitrificans]